ncbi:ribosomal protein S18-alanine N-acetyltransferase [Paenactinomyces guangxiensis]|uniref:Ribosomal protein S18-alanine N-acetyltransferase n=1 Tax=Paenactinomyces guangxiensis TaxID=1490290 RepID=A0A7W2A9T2_9BACL|nr:ribosomal protein S18-alanine N-acetyltransferase [Paenactinomyces guangxiensis]MBA4495574.1 ribosomal protein S18-alanine N-acetyltransferase [Paenactinomyces guangxiensis]MBH8592832.1 ribosomal protein S18-alanine N-acetyltransferase [Paenactinomyces guangxiensis]
MEKKAEGEVVFRPMKLSDLPQIEIVENSSFSAPWPRQAFYNELVFNQFARYTVVTVDGKVAGYCGCWMILDEAHITNIAIHPDYRGRGLGEAILTYVMEMSRSLGACKMTLEVRVSNSIAQSLYEKLGFERSGVRPKYYTDNQEDAIIMWVTLNEQSKRNSITGN